MPCCWPDLVEDTYVRFDTEGSEKSGSPSSVDEYEAITSAASLHVGSVLVPYFTNKQVEKAYGASIFRKNIMIHLFCFSCICVGDLFNLVGVLHRLDPNSSAWDQLVDQASDYADLPMLVAIVVYRMRVHQHPNREEAHSRFSLVFTRLLPLLLALPAVSFALAPVESMLAPFMQGYDGMLFLTYGTACIMIGFALGSFGLPHGTKYRLFCVMVLFLWVPLYIVSSLFEEEWKQVAAKSGECQSNGVLLRMLLLSTSSTVFLILGLLTSHCVDCLWREAFIRQALKRVTDRRQIELLSNEKKALSLQRGADSRLNHIMKNKCGGAVQLLELFKSEALDASAASAGSAPDLSKLDVAVESLTQAIEWLVRTLAPEPEPQRTQPPPRSSRYTSPTASRPSPAQTVFHKTSDAPPALCAATLCRAAPAAAVHSTGEWHLREQADALRAASDARAAPRWRWLGRGRRGR
eukprot:1602103-Prymnesium_polylepis.2